MEATARKKSIPIAIWVALGIIVALLATYPFFWKPIKDTPATEGQSFPNAPTPPNEPGAPEEPVPRPNPTL